MPSPSVIKSRYEIKSVLGRGGMGVVYLAFDTLMKREVALKTLREVPDSVLVELFYRECTVLAGMVHPNVIEIFDMGEFSDENDVSRPFFVMPLLPGGTLHDLLYPMGIPIPLSRGIDIVCQASRGLQAAHERGLLHRDIKPRNIFVMKDDAVKLIDFGVAHLMGNESTGMRGTPQYMSPEQITFRPMKVQSDIFSMATVCYEVLTAVHPFLRDPDRRDSPSDIAEAITAHIPPLASDLNPSVNRQVALAIAKGMAKDPLSRFESAAAFAEALQKGLRNERSSPSNVAGVQVRLGRARRSLEQNDYQFASEIIGELEAEGHSDVEIRKIRAALDEAIRKEKTDRLIEAANRCFASEEFTLALRKVQELLQIDPANAAAVQLKKKIEDLLTEQKVSELLKAAAEHIEHSAFTTARQAIQDALKLRPNDSRARQLLKEVESKQKELLRQRQEQERLYQTAHAAWLVGKIDSALADLEELTQLTRFSEPRDRLNEYQEFHRRVRAEREALETALKHGLELLNAGDLAAASRIADRYLTKYPEHQDFVEFSRQIAQARRAEEEAYRKNVANRLAAERNLELRIGILEEALQRWPDEEFFQAEMRRLLEKQQQVAQLAAQARNLEKQQNFEQALKQWRELELIYPEFPALQQQIQRTFSAWLAQRAKAKANWISRITRSLEQEDLAAADRLIGEAERELPDDPDLLSLRSRVDDLGNAVKRLASLLDESARAVTDRDLERWRVALLEAVKVSEGSAKLAKALSDTSIQQCTALLPDGWRFAKAMLGQLPEIAAGVKIPRQLLEEVQRLELEAQVVGALEEASRFADSGQLAEAKQLLQKALGAYGLDARLQQQLSAIEQAIAEKRLKEERNSRLESLKKVRAELARSEEPAKAPEILEQAKSISRPFSKDVDFVPVFMEIADQVDACERARACLASDRVSDCLAICARLLERFPEHRIFLTLKAQAELRESEIAAKYLEGVVLQLSAEASLEKRSAILEAALKAFPEEPFYQEELSLVKGKQDLVKAIADRARAFEKQGLLPEASERWQYLKTIYPIYPGLDQIIGEIARLLEEKRRKAKHAYIEQIEDALARREYSLASQTLKGATAEFADDQDFERFAQLIQAGRERQLQAERLLNSGLDDLKAGDFQSGEERLRKCLELIPDDPGNAKKASDYLLQYASAALENDLDRAESMISGARLAYAKAQLPEGLLRDVAEARRARDFKACQASARIAEEQGNFPDALRPVREFLARYPGDSEAAALEQRLLEAAENARKLEQRARDLNELNALDAQAEGAPLFETILDILERTQQIALRSAYDSAVTVAASYVGDVLSTMADIHRLIDRGDLKAAEELCERSLQRFPDRSGFLELERLIQRKQQERAAEYLQEVGQKLAKVSAFGERARILEAAVQLYPNETYYLEELSLVRNKQSFLDAEIARAREFERKELFEDALRDWEALHLRYPWLPSCEVEIQRISEKWKKRNDKRAQDWIARIDNALLATDYDSASRLSQRAVAEIPGDDRLLELKDRSAKLKQNQLAAGELVTNAKALLLEGDPGGAIGCLEKASRLLPADQNLRSNVLTVIDRSKDAWLEEHWQQAERLVNTLKELRPNEAIPASLSAALSARRSAAELNAVLQQADAMRKQGNLAGALTLIETAELRWPADARVVSYRESLREQLQRLEAEQRRAAALAEIAAIHSGLATARSRRQLLRLKKSFLARPLAHSGDAEVQSASTALLLEIDTTLQSLETSGKRRPAKQWVLAIVVVAIIVVVGISYWLFSPARPQPVAVAVRPENVQISVEAYNCVTPNCDLRLSPGRHEVHLSKAGYASQTVVLTVSGHGGRLEAALLPLPAAVQLEGNVEGASIYLDGTRRGTLDSGQFAFQTLAPGQHTIRITGEGGEASIPILFQPDATVHIGKLVSSPGLSMAVVGQDSGNFGLWTAAISPQPVNLNRQRLGSTSNGYLQLPKLAGTAAEIQIGDSENAVKFTLPANTKPAVFAFITGGRSTGTLSVTTNVANAQLLLDGKLYPGAGTKQRLVLPAKTYELRASHAGYVTSNPVSATVERGAETNIAVQLTPKPALLQIRGAAAGTSVQLDRGAAALAGPNNALSLEVAPGIHTVTLSRDGYSPKRLQRRFEPGESVIFTPADLALTKQTLDVVALEKQDWSKVNSDGQTLVSLQEFLRKYPNGLHAQAANAKLEQLEWNALDKQSASNLRAFIGAYPNGPHKDMAERLLDDLARAEKIQTEESLWKSTGKDSQTALDAFLARFPTGRHADSARELLAELKKKEESARLEQVENTAWNSVDPTNRQSLEDYLKRFPAARHSVEAGLNLSKLPRTDAPNADSSAILAAIQKLADAWSRKDLEGILAAQPDLNRRDLKSQLESLRSMRMTIRPTSTPRIDGDRGTLVARRKVDQTFNDGTPKSVESVVTFKLAKRNATWIVEGTAR